MTESHPTESMTDTYPVVSFVDVPVIAGGALLIAMAVLEGAIQGTARLVVSVPLLLFAPGYALLAALFPESTVHGVDARGPLGAIPRGPGLGWGERIALSIPTSLSLLPPLGVAFALAGVPLSTAAIVGGVTAVTILSSAVGALRRMRLPPERRLGVPVDRWADDLRAAFVTPGAFDTVLNVVLVVAVVSALAGLAFGLAAPDRGEAYTEAALLTDDGESLIAGNYTTEIAAGDPVSNTVTVENHEGEERTYSLVVAVERVRTADGETNVVERRELTREQGRVDDGSTWRAPTTVRPSLLGDELRLSYYLYTGDAPDAVTGAQADRHLYLWISVAPSTGAGGTADVRVEGV